jgi:hypothetical protein
MGKSAESVIGSGEDIQEALKSTVHLPFFMKVMRSDGSTIAIE